MLEALCFLALVAMFTSIYLFLPNLPEQIPTHFNFAGEPDRWSGSSSIWAVPILTLVIYIGLTVLEFFPHIFNYTVPITNQNAQAQYKVGFHLMLYLKLELVALFCLMHVKILMISMDTTKNLGGWIFIPFILILLATTVYFVRQSFKLK